VELNIITQALAPLYKVRAISLTTKPISPNSQTSTTSLKQVEQTAYNATFVARGVMVELDKGVMTASLKLVDMEYSCK